MRGQVTLVLDIEYVEYLRTLRRDVESFVCVLFPYNVTYVVLYVNGYLLVIVLVAFLIGSSYSILAFFILTLALLVCIITQLGKWLPVFRFQ